MTGFEGSYQYFWITGIRKLVDAEIQFLSISIESNKIQKFIRDIRYEFLIGNRLLLMKKM